MTDGVDEKAFEYALGRIDDGFLFERFAQEFLASILGYTFIPAGGLHDRGIDGLQHISTSNGLLRQVFQMSIEKAPSQKLRGTLRKLTQNNIEFDNLVFVTNQKFPNQDLILDQLINQYNKNVRIYDLAWFSARVNTTSTTINLYHSFISENLHEFNQPGKSFQFANLESDPRLYVFLRQQWEEKRKDLALDAILADTLILYCLEGTDPEKGLIKSADQIKSDIKNLIKFDPKLIYKTIDQRLFVLSKKPRKINHHSKLNGYCLPYETRLAIQEKNLSDQALFENFLGSASQIFNDHLQNQKVNLKSPEILIGTVINKLYYQQGLEFSNFVLNGENVEAIEKNLQDIIGNVVDESRIVPLDKNKISTALLLTIRDIVYRGNEDIKEILRKLSSTYMMLFMLQCDPKLAIFFGSLAAKLEIYVCTSIIIPALSEYHLEENHRRHWNLLKGANAAGVTLIIDEHVINEIVTHLGSIKHKFETVYKDNEDIYLDELQMLYIDEILIRAYFYARMDGKVSNFDDFLDSFVNPDLSNAEEGLIEWLKSEFGMKYKHSKSIKVTIDPNEEEILLQKLIPHKGNKIAKARDDVRTILTIYALREKNSENSSSGIFGYRTWWLSKDTSTYRVVNEVFKEKYKVSCYIRPDFLYNYIILGPNKDEVDNVYKIMFPSLIGANISFHLDKELLNFIHEKISEHQQKNPSRIKAILRELAEKLKFDPIYQTRNSIELYLDEKLKDITNSN